MSSLKRAILLAGAGLVALLVGAVLLFVIFGPRLRAAGNFERALTSAVASGRDTVDLAQLPAPPWDQLHVFGPHTGRADIEKALGFSWNGREAHTIGHSDGVNLLVFVHQGQVALAVLHPRNRGDFYPDLTGRRLTRDEARLSIVRRAKDGWVVLKPAGTPTPAR